MISEPSPVSLEEGDLEDAVGNEPGALIALYFFAKVASHEQGAVHADAEVVWQESDLHQLGEGGRGEDERGREPDEDGDLGLGLGPLVGPAVAA